MRSRPLPGPVGFVVVYQCTSVKNARSNALQVLATSFPLDHRQSAAVGQQHTLTNHLHHQFDLPHLQLSLTSIRVSLATPRSLLSHLLLPNLLNQSFPSDLQWFLSLQNLANTQSDASHYLQPSNSDLRIHLIITKASCLPLHQLVSLAEGSASLSSVHLQGNSRLQQQRQTLLTEWHKNKLKQCFFLKTVK